MRIAKSVSFLPSFTTLAKLVTLPQVRAISIDSLISSNTTIASLIISMPVSYTHLQRYSEERYRDKRGRKGSIIAVIQGTKTDDIIAVLTKMPQELRNQVKEITLRCV